MTKKFVIKETVNHYHEVEIDEELDIEDIVACANASSRLYNTGYEALEDKLKQYKERYGFDYNVKPNYCGTEIVNMEVEDEVD